MKIDVFPKLNYEIREVNFLSPLSYQYYKGTNISIKQYNKSKEQGTKGTKGTIEHYLTKKCASNLRILPACAHLLQYDNHHKTSNFYSTICSYFFPIFFVFQPTSLTYESKTLID